jgi:thiol-disulfide isomerase/thioredoxin
MPTARQFRLPFALLLLGMLGCSPFTSRDTAKETRKVEFLVFSAKWCSYCKQVPPVTKKLEANYPDVTFLELDVDEEEGGKLAAEYNAEALPYYIIRIDGKVVARQRGLLPYADADKFLRGAMKK